MVYVDKVGKLKKLIKDLPDDTDIVWYIEDEPAQPGTVEYIEPQPWEEPELRISVEL